MPEGTEVVRARALLRAAQRARCGAGRDPPPFPGPEARARQRLRRGRAAPMFATDAMEIRFVEGTFVEPGPATAWFRLRLPLVAGEPSRRRLSGSPPPATSATGSRSVLAWDEHLFINPDLTLYFEREPVDEWVALQAQTRVPPGGVGRRRERAVGPPGPDRARHPGAGTSAER